MYRPRPQKKRPIWLLLIPFIVLYLFSSQHTLWASLYDRLIPHAHGGGGKVAATPTPPPTLTQVVQRDLALWPFTAHSPWNVPLATTAQLAASNDACDSDLHDTAYAANMNAATWSHAIYVAKASDPLTPISYDPASGHADTLSVTINIPIGATPSPPAVVDGGDARMYIIDPTHHYVEELWKAHPRPGGGWLAWAIVRNDLTTDGIGHYGTRAYGGSGIGGLIRVGELENGIHHAIAFAVPQAKEVDHWVWPAIANDSYPPSTYTGSIPMGQLVALPPTIDVTTLGLSPQGLAMAHALQDYGGYVVDSSTDYSYYADTPVQHELPASFNSDLNKLHFLLHCVTSNGPNTIGGAPLTAPRRAPWAPLLTNESAFPSRLPQDTPTRDIDIPRTGCPYTISTTVVREVGALCAVYCA